MTSPCQATSLEEALSIARSIGFPVRVIIPFQQGMRPVQTFANNQTLAAFIDSEVALGDGIPITILSPRRR